MIFTNAKYLRHAFHSIPGENAAHSIVTLYLELIRLAISDIINIVLVS